MKTSKTLSEALETRIPHVNTIGALKNAPTDKSIDIHVRDVRRGGNFTYAASGFTTNNITVFDALGGGFWVRQYVGSLNAMWGSNVRADGQNDDSPGVQSVIDFARNQGLGSTYQRYNVVLPEGVYKFNSTINATNAPGLQIRGSGGRYLNTIINANTGGIVFDFTGSTHGGIANLRIHASDGFSNPSTIALQYALSANAVTGTDKGGLNCRVENVVIEMGSFPAANAGYGSIGILNCRSEEFAAHNVTVLAKTPYLFSTTPYPGNFTGRNLTVSSPFETVQTSPNGSMGVINLSSGQNSVSTWGFDTPAFELVGVNGFKWHGYVGRLDDGGPNPGNWEAAFNLTNQTYSVDISGTIEWFSSVARIQNNTNGLKIYATLANQRDHTQPVLRLEQDYLTLGNLDLAVEFGNPYEMSNRYLLYTGDKDGGNSAITTKLVNPRVACSRWADNSFIMSRNLLPNVSYGRFETGQPVECRAGVWYQLFENPKPAGTRESPQTVQVIRFDRADRGDRTQQNAGSYCMRLYGEVIGGSYNSGVRALRRFEAILTYGQNYNLSDRSVDVQISYPNGNGFSTHHDSLYIGEISVSLDYSDDTRCRVLVTPTAGGANGGEPLVVNCRAELSADFGVNGTIIYD